MQVNSSFVSYFIQASNYPFRIFYTRTCEKYFDESQYISYITKVLLIFQSSICDIHNKNKYINSFVVIYLPLSPKTYDELPIVGSRLLYTSTNFQLQNFAEKIFLDWLHSTVIRTNVFAKWYYASSSKRIKVYQENIY